MESEQSTFITLILVLVRQLFKVELRDKGTTTELI
jgi:hypothetical protein